MSLLNLVVPSREENISEEMMGEDKPVLFLYYVFYYKKQ